MKTPKSPRTLRIALLFLATMTIQISFAAKREFREYPSLEDQANMELPADYKEETEFVIARLMYPTSRFARFGHGDWTQGGTAWAVDYPRGDRDFARLLRRITRVHVRSVEQPVNLDDDDDVFYWPFVIVGLPGHWDLTDAQAKKLREYLLRGGFLLCDSFFGTREWEGFIAGMKKVFPDRPIIDLPADHPIFHTVYDLSNKTQVGNWYAYQGSGVPYRLDGDTPHWRGIADDKGRLMVVIDFNNDLGDGWQYTDDPSYPLKDANMSIKFGANIVVYAMTH